MQMRFYGIKYKEKGGFLLRLRGAYLFFEAVEREKRTEWRKDERQGEPNRLCCRSFKSMLQE